jgi:hypothetical protein
VHQTTEVLLNAIEAQQRTPQVPSKRYTVLERAYNRERPVFASDDRADAIRVAEQHAARRVVDRGPA